MIKHKLLQIKKGEQQSGFTIVELIVVVAVIAILATVSTFAYINVKKQSYDAAIVAKVAWLERQLDRYKNDHGEYPVMEALNPGTSATNVSMSDWSAAAQILNVDATYLNGPNDIKFHSLCASGCGGAPQKNQYEYVALNGSSNTAGVAYSWNIPAIGCLITIQYSDPSYVFVYFNSYKNVWVFNKSPHGTATVVNSGGGPSSPQTCTFT